MIGKVCRRGTDTRRLLGYLFTEGLAGERGLDSAHVDARSSPATSHRAGSSRSDGPMAGRTWSAWPRCWTRPYGPAG